MTIDERIAKLMKELEYQSGERAAAEALHKYVGYYGMAIKQHIETIGKEIDFLNELK